MSEAEFADYLKDQLRNHLDSGDVLMSGEDEGSFIYVDAENEVFWRVSVEAAEVK